MTKLDIVLSAMRSLGRQDALDLRGRAADMDGTAIIDEETKIPAWDGEKDYSSWPAGAPVRDGEQVYKLLQPHNAAHYPGTSPKELPALWSVAHTTDPDRAKPWAAPDGLSGAYMAGECYRDAVGTVWRCKADNTVFAAEEYLQAWEIVSELDTGKEYT